MKILAVRGFNLNSLAGSFDVDLDSGVLGGVGLFAITGPTGAGKTTLLDAICVALFDRVPRYNRESRLTGDVELQPNDSRQMLRRGCAEAWAEVDFIGKDLKRYRSRWQVRRARNQPDGRLQASTIRFQLLADETELGDTKKTDTLALIEDRLGLNFDQFCRSVLLSQGDFAAFLKAKPRERGEILEGMTGAHIYSMLSRAAYERAKQEASELAILERDRDQLDVMNEAELRLHIYRQFLLSEAIRLLEAHEEGLKKGKAWYAQRDTISELVAAKIHEQDAARKALEAIDETKLLQAKEAFQLEPYIRAVDGAEQTLQNHQQALADTKAAIKAKQAELLLKQEQQQQALLKLNEAEAAYKGMADEIEAARNCDSQLEHAQNQAASVHQQLEEALKLYEEASEQVSGLTARLAQDQKAIQTIADWLDVHCGDEPFANERTYWDKELIALPALEGAVKQAKATLEPLEKECDGLAKALEKGQADVDQVQVRLDGCLAEEAAAKEKLEGLDGETLTEQIGRLTKRATKLGHLLNYQQAAEGLAEQLKIKEAQHQTSVDELHALEAALPELQSRSKDTDSARQKAKQGLRLIEESMELSTKLNHFEVGQPCPLCGSKNHPYREQMPSSQQLSPLQENLRVLEQSLERIQAQVAENKASQKATRGQMKRLADEIEVLKTRLQNSVGHIESAQDAVADRSLTDAAKTAVLLDANQTELNRLQRTQKDFEACRKAYDAMHDQAKKARTQLENTRASVDTLKNQRDRVEKQKAKLESTYERAVEDFEAACQRVAALFDENVAAHQLKSDLNGFCEAQKARLATYVAKKEAHQKLEGQMVASTNQLNSAKALAEERRRPVEGLKKTDLEAKQAVQKISSQRQTLLQGVAVKDVIAREETRLKALSEACENGRARVAELEKVGHGLEEKGEQQRTACERLAAEVVTAQNALIDRLETAGLEEALVRESLSMDRTALETALKALERAKKHNAESAVRVQEAKAQLQRHDEAERPKDSRPTLEARLEKLAEDEKQLGTAHSENALKLLHDKERRKALTQLMPRIEDQKARCELWQKMALLIGSADGDKFRKFAQSLTLDALLNAANHHLQELKPRYALKRMQGSDLDLMIVDQYMADEGRNVAGLSGGETFLVSLALALGLSSMTAEGADIGSLFIDEGFGALDPESLDAALSVLEQLQASGRQVGIISHVPAVGERISAKIRVISKGNGRGALKIEGPGTA